MRADAESSCPESRTDSWSLDAARNPWSAPTTELWAPTSLGEAHPRWFQSYERDWLSRRSVATSTVAVPGSGVQAPHSADGLGGGDGALAMNVAGVAAHPLCGREDRLLSGRH